jgi:uncharacterized protein YjiS (DUF1127 family)
MKSICQRSGPNHEGMHRVKTTLPARTEGGIGGGVVRRAILAATRAVIDWLEYRRQMRQLAALDDRLLRDVGLTEADRLGSTIAPRCRRHQSRRRH